MAAPRVFKPRIPVRAANWFPRHMAIGFQKMEARIRAVDLLVEVCDARIPFSSRNPRFHHRFYASRPHILVLNKVDLIDRRHIADATDVLQNHFGIEHIFWTNFKTGEQRSRDARRLVNTAARMITEMNRYNRSDCLSYDMMAIGIPNVGKSTLINALRNVVMNMKGRPAPIGPFPGVTRTVMGKVKVCDSPALFICDTPGVLPQKLHLSASVQCICHVFSIVDVESGMKTALCDCVLKSVTEMENVASYLLFWMNENHNYAYVRACGLRQPVDDIHKLLFSLCELEELKKHTISVTQSAGREQTYDFDGASSRFVNMFRTGKFGDQFLDGDLLEKYRSGRHPVAPLTLPADEI